ncbi:MAG: LptF/LptG family permease, partial [Bacteroidota bacterium]|nr:LptF/LptG family permease [Bacteroidota bacterium]
MFKKLDKLILKAFFWPFLASFFISLFVFVMQILWKYIDDLVGKGLDFWTLAKFLVYASATLVSFSLPIAILISSIMTFGKLGENFELVAIKSSGISMLRFMRPLLIVSIFLTGIAFVFANWVTPVANLKFAVIYNDIYRKTPAFDLRDGVFYYGFQGFAMRVSKKDKDRQTLHNVLIYEQGNPIQDNTIISESGKMTVSKDKKFLEFHLQNGHRYSENGNFNSPNNEFVQLGFKEYNKLFDLTQFDLKRTSDSLFMNNMTMKTLRQLDKDIDSIRKIPDSLVAQIRHDLKIYIPFVKNLDSTSSPGEMRMARRVIAGKHPRTFRDLIPDSLQNFIHEQATSSISNMKSIIQVNADQYDNQVQDIILHRIQWHKKLSLSVACLVLFLIGAPLGSIIRRGGLGMPLVVALIFFLVFYLLMIFGEKFSKDDLLVPIAGMWLPVIALTPIGVFLTYKAMHDSPIFSKEFYLRLFKPVRSGVVYLGR